MKYVRIYSRLSDRMVIIERVDNDNSIMVDRMTQKDFKGLNTTILILKYSCNTPNVMRERELILQGETTRSKLKNN